VLSFLAPDSFRLKRETTKKGTDGKGGKVGRTLLQNETFSAITLSDGGRERTVGKA